MIVASGEEDGSGFVSDEALGDSIRSEVRRRSGVRFLRNGGLADDFDGQGVSARAWFELIDFDEDWFLLLLRSMSRRRRRRRLVLLGLIPRLRRRRVSSLSARRRRSVSVAGSLLRVVGGV